MQLRTNFERSCKPFKTEDIPYGMSFFYVLDEVLIFKAEDARQVSSYEKT
jgi:hypothetical protein